ncbi:apolipoprotein N-acyltransferase [Cyanobium sp. Morenito 9A2]|uniref:apolipoprotein N-acyltransferase n=1 Tax=Cyanobium sp. Morenito 9A2 TaxID=2823718 RepID=UPI0020CE7C3C|nr:apolipoprotein N-acyltransferase [Cyanobium sp. Morenito 9A2]MCP9849055.1 apolipoprotein N-acyltransferase [Cyanobium sp. Morenito 9A2]
MGNDRRMGGLTALGGGLLAGVALPPLGWPPLLWLALVPLWRESVGPRPRPFLVGCFWGFAAVLVSHRWLLALHPLDWVGVPLPLSLPLVTALWIGLGLLGGLLVGVWRLLVERLGSERFSTALIGALLWGLAETLLAKGPLFWIGLGAAALPGDPPLAGLAALGGSALVAAAQLLMAWALARAFGAVGSPWRRWTVLGALVLTFHLVGALAPSGAAPATAALPPVRLLVLQPAIPTREKFRFSQQQRLLDLLAMAQREADQRHVDGLVLPEGALPLGQPLPLRTEAVVLGGGFRYASEQLRSSLLRFSPGEQLPGHWVDKHRLVPLGEWVPFADWFRWAGLSAVGGVTPGVPSRLLAAQGSSPVGAIGVAICYELSDGAALADAVRGGAGWLLASANLDPYPAQLQDQFVALARLRAIETGRWLVSSANTGPSLVVDAQGRVQRRLEAGRTRTGVMELQPLRSLTPYDRWGDAPLWLALGGVVVMRVYRNRGGRVGGT